MKLTVPVVPDGPTAAQWATDELAKPIYHASSSLLNQLREKILAWLFNLLRDLDRQGVSPWVLLVVLAVVFALALWLFVGVRIRRQRHAQARTVFTTALATSGDYFTQANLARARGDLDAAFLATFRALVIAMAERALIEANPGTTAREAAGGITAAFPSARPELAWAADMFDAIAYADAHATAAADAALVSLVERLASMREVVPV